MSVAKHTPGPWPNPEPSGDGKILFIEKNGPGDDNWHRLIVEVDSDDCDSATALANARLIAAAPDLLAALEGMLHIWRDVGGDQGNYYVEQAEAAITKATEGV